MRLFSRRTTGHPASVASSASNRDSADSDHVLPDKTVYNIPPPPAKLKLPFRRRPPAPRPDPTDNEFSLNDAPNISSVTSDPGHGLPPPPRKSALFGVRNQSVHSVHSLPNHPSTHDTLPRPSSSHIRSEAHLPPPPQPKKSPGLFSWARERTKSKPPLPFATPPSISSSSSADHSSSFNLKSFRHVGADSPSPLPDALLPPPRPRPRGDSAASDASQRISVAAFREAHARSRANSPVPSFRPPSAADTLRVDVNGRKRASTVSVVSATDHPQPNKNIPPPAPMPSTRPDPARTDSDDNDDDSDSSSDEDVDSDGEPIPKPARQRTIRRRADGSPAGPGPKPADLSHARQHSHSASPPTQSDLPPSARQRASASTSALTSNAAACRASVLAGTNSSCSSHTQSRRLSRNPDDDTDESTDSEDTDSEDMPLSGIAPPRRPGSSTSNYSTARPRIPPKPLIDINTLAGSPPLLTPILRHENSVKNLQTKGKEPDVEKDQPFSIPAVLALSSSSSPPISPSISKQHVPLVTTPASTAHNRKSSGDMLSLPKPKGTEHDDDLMNAIRLVGALDKEQDQSGAPVKSPSGRIVPTPIREREPPTSFTVLSRPPQRQSTAETSGSLSPTSPNRSSVSSPTLSPQPELGARQRASTMINPPTQKDKSDTMSVTSTARSSTSRNSSRIPPVPLIHSIPDSPSVKEDYKPGRPRSTSRASATSASQGRAQPSPIPPVPAMPSSASSKMPGFQPSAMPQRPFASNSSLRGESPAGSSTGDSSSGRAPFTPRDGSDIGIRSKDDASDVGSTLKARGHGKRPSVTFEDQVIRGRERAKTDVMNEQRTRERRRSEAKAALELGKIVNGRGPLVNDDEDDMGMRGRNPSINVTAENGVPGMVQPSWPAWQQPVTTGMTAMVPPQFSNDPAYFAAHQRALLIAKQAYQMAVAQHAMQIAGEEWERSSNAGFGSGGSVYGGGSGGSVYGGGSGGSVYGGVGAGMAPMNMMSVPNMGMLVPPNQWTGRSSIVFPSATASVYGGISSSQSEYGGAVGGWSTRSVYGDSFGPLPSRSGHAGNGVPTSSASVYGGNSRPRASTSVAPSSSSSSQPPKGPGKTPARARAAPPSSWKNVQ